MQTTMRAAASAFEHTLRGDFATAADLLATWETSRCRAIRFWYTLAVRTSRLEYARETRRDYATMIPNRSCATASSGE